MSEEKDGVYCKVCGGIIPQDTKIGSIPVNGKPTGINQLDFILEEVAALHLQNDSDLKTELITRAKVLNYIPTKMTGKYAEGLLQAYKDHHPQKE